MNCALAHSYGLSDEEIAIFEGVRKKEKMEEDIYKLILPESNDMDDWFHFILQNRTENTDVKKVIVDFNQRQHLDPDDLVVLACLIEIFYSDGAQIEFINDSEKLSSFLHEIKFKQYWNKGFNREKYTISRNETTLCLWKICEENIYQYSAFASDYFKTKFLNNKDLVPLSSNLNEVFNNVLNHSESSDNSYIMVQFYEKENKLTFCICDFGIGIPNSVNRFRKLNKKNPISDQQALSRALEEGYSVKSTPRNRGLGLYYIFNLIEDSKGLLEIISNNATLIKNEDGMLFDLNNYNFNGTFIKVSIDLDILEDFDNEEFESDFYN